VWRRQALERDKGCLITGMKARGSNFTSFEVSHIFSPAHFAEVSLMIYRNLPRLPPLTLKSCLPSGAKQGSGRR
jgi:hypothetical protein